MASLLFWRLRFATLPGIWDLGFGVSIAHTLAGRKRHWRLEAVQSASEKEELKGPILVPRPKH
jgi:hypothetical protein